MSKPSFPFYPDDWMNDLGLRICSLSTRAIWIDLICMMHQGVPYGHLADAGGPIPVKIVAARCHCTVKQLATALQELELHQVFSKTNSGVIFSRRMVRDEHNRAARGNGGMKAYLLTSQKQDTKPPFDPEEEKEEVKDSKQEKIPTAWFSEQHERWYLGAFWNHKNRSKSEVAYKKAVYRLMEKRAIDADAVAAFLFQAAIDDRKRFEHTQDWDWRANLHPATWLNGDRWEDKISIVSVGKKDSRETLLDRVLGGDCDNAEMPTA